VRCRIEQTQANATNAKGCHSSMMALFPSRIAVPQEKRNQAVAASDRPSRMRPPLRLAGVGVNDEEPAVPALFYPFANSAHIELTRY